MVGVIWSKNSNINNWMLSKILSQSYSASTCERNGVHLRLFIWKKKKKSIGAKNTFTIWYFSDEFHMEKTSKNKKINNTTLIPENINTFREMDEFYYNERETNDSGAALSFSSEDME